MNSIAIVMLLWQQGESAADPHRWSVRIGQAVRSCRPCHVAKVTYFCFTSSVLFVAFLLIIRLVVFPLLVITFFSSSRCSAEVIAFSELVSSLCPFIPDLPSAVCLKKKWCPTCLLMPYFTPATASHLGAHLSLPHRIHLVKDQQQSHSIVKKNQHMQKILFPQYYLTNSHGTYFYCVGALQSTLLIFPLSALHIACIFIFLLGRILHI